MIPKILTEDDLQKSYFFWRRYYKFADTDKELDPFLSADIGPSRQAEPWLHRVRDALFLSRRIVAQRMGTTVANLASLEKSEQNQSITLQKLHEVAEAMGCELVYAIRPKARMRFSEIIWQQLWPQATQNWWVQTSRAHHQRLRRLGAVSRDEMLNAKSRREQGWTQRKY